MAFRDQLRLTRKSRGMSQTELAEHVGGAKDVIYRIETGAVHASPEQVAIAARVLHAPELLVQHCEECPVASALLPVRYPVLDQVATHPAVVAHKISEECTEAAAAGEELFAIFNRVGWQEGGAACERVAELLVQVRDVEVAIQILYRALFLGQLLPLSVLKDVQRRHLEKCIERGYCTPTGTEG